MQQTLFLMPPDVLSSQCVMIQCNNHICEAGLLRPRVNKIQTLSENTDF